MDLCIYSFLFPLAHAHSSVSPLDGLLLLLHHVGQLLEYRAQLHDGALNVLHRVCTALDVCILQQQFFILKESIEGGETQPDDG